MLDHFAMDGHHLGGRLYAAFLREESSLPCPRVPAWGGHLRGRPGWQRGNVHLYHALALHFRMMACKHLKSSNVARQLGIQVFPHRQLRSSYHPVLPCHVLLHGAYAQRALSRSCSWSMRAAVIRIPPESSLPIRKHVQCQMSPN